MLIDPAYGQAEAIREGFPYLTGQQFFKMFHRHMTVPAHGLITRIEFRHV
jgi:hypothetical protein